MIGSTKIPMITALFNDQAAADRAYEFALSRGYDRGNIDVLVGEDTHARQFAEKHKEGSKALEGAGVGSALGGTLGALAAALTAVGTIAIPGVGILAAGPLAAAFTGAGAGGLAGGLLGALVGAGIPEEHAKHYDQGLRKGGIVLGVRPRSLEDAELIQREWNALSNQMFQSDIQSDTSRAS